MKGLKAVAGVLAMASGGEGVTGEAPEPISEISRAWLFHVKRVHITRRAQRRMIAAAVIHVEGRW